MSSVNTPKSRNVIFIALSSLALESTDKPAASNVLCSRAVAGASKVLYSDCLVTLVALVLLCKFAIALLLCQSFHSSCLQRTNMTVL